MEGLNSYGERRQNPRYPVRLPLDYSETSGVLRGALVADISEVGLRIHSVHSIQTGAELKIRVYVSKEVVKSSGKLSIGKENGKGFNMGFISQK